MKKILFVFLLLLTLVLCYLSFQPGEVSYRVSDRVAEWLGIEPENGSDHASFRVLAFGLDLRKIIHLTAYGTLAICLFFVLSDKTAAWKRAAIAIFFPFLLACLDEYHQTLMPQRAGLMHDVLVDLTGICLGVGIALLIRGVILLLRKK